jgi:nitroreductase
MKNLTDLIRERRSIRKYTDEQLKDEDLRSIIEAGLYAPNAGGGQRTYLVAVHNKELTETLGKLNLSGFNRDNLIGDHVSKEQPSVIDDPTIKSGFYGAPTVCAIFAPARFLYGTADAFCCASYMVLKAQELGIASCIVARGDETFASDYGKQFLTKWDVPEGYHAVCFVILGYCDGEYPTGKPRRDKRYIVVE